MDRETEIEKEERSGASGSEGERVRDGGLGGREVGVGKGQPENTHSGHRERGK
jgi:hypothetical protein